jgi:ADP-heptose:LPS heptosyltransferase
VASADVMTFAPVSPIVIRWGAVGDMIALSPLLNFLHRRYGRPCVLIGERPWTEPLFRGNPDVARVFSMPRHVPILLARTGWRLVSALRRSGLAPVYVCEDDDKKVRRIRGLLTFGGVDPRRCVFIGAGGIYADEHQIDYFIRCGECTPEALNEASYPLPTTAPAFVWLPQNLDSEHAELQVRMERQGWSGRQLILVHPGNRRTMSSRRERHRRLARDDKAWPMQRWVELFHKIHARMPHALIVLCGAAQEAPMLWQLCAAADLEAVVVASLPLRPFFALCQAAHSMISIDTGPAHAAAALNLPLVVLFGSQRQSRWLPRSSGAPVIGLGGPPVSSRVDQIPVATVFDAWCSLADRIPVQRLEVQPDSGVTIRQLAPTGP